MTSYIYPVRDRILVERLEDPDNDRTPAGILLPAVASDKELIRGRVVAVGEGPASASRSMTPPVSLDDIVYYPKQVGVDVRLGNKTYKVLQYEQAFLFETTYNDHQGESLAIDTAPTFD